jgi:hypothetical protein
LKASAVVGIRPPLVTIARKLSARLAQVDGDEDEERQVRGDEEYAAR